MSQILMSKLVVGGLILVFLQLKDADDWIVTVFFAGNSNSYYVKYDFLYLSCPITQVLNEYLVFILS